MNAFWGFANGQSIEYNYIGLESSSKGSRIMFAAELLRYVRQKPFVPFRLHVSEGAVYEVRHPDLIIVTVDFVTIGHPDPAHPGMALRLDSVNMNHVIRIEPIAASVVPPSVESN